MADRFAPKHYGRRCYNTELIVSTIGVIHLWFWQHDWKWPWTLFQIVVVDKTWYEIIVMAFSRRHVGYSLRCHLSWCVQYSHNDPMLFERPRTVLVTWCWLVNVQFSDSWKTLCEWLDGQEQKLQWSSTNTAKMKQELEELQVLLRLCHFHTCFVIWITCFFTLVFPSECTQWPCCVRTVRRAWQVPFSRHGRVSGRSMWRDYSVCSSQVRVESKLNGDRYYSSPATGRLRRHH